MKFIYYISIYLFFFFISCSITFAQTDSTYLKTEEILENILQNPVGEIDESNLYDILEQLMLNTINLNKASVDDLTRIPEVDISDARLIVNHRNKYGSFFSLNELNTVEDLNKELIKKITPFIYIEQKLIRDERKPEQIGSFISQTKFLLRSRIINSLQTNEGFNRNKFEGTKPRVYNRLLLKYSNNFQAGILAEKDPGESSFNEFTTYHLALNDVGFIYKAVVMDYYLEFGQGLTM